MDLGRLEQLAADAPRTPRRRGRRSRGPAARPAAAARVVAETETCSRRPGRSRSRCTSVLLPEPEGPERTISRPGSSSSQPARTTSGKGCRDGTGDRPWAVAGSRRATAIPSSSRSLHILDQFPDFFQKTFDFNHVTADLDVVGLGADRVHLAAHLLDDELELAAARSRCRRGSPGTGPGGPAAGRSPRRCRCDRRGWRPRGSGPWASTVTPWSCDQGLDPLGEALLVRSGRPGGRGRRSGRGGRRSPGPGDCSSAAMARPSWARAASSLAERLGDHPGDRRPVVVRVRRPRAAISSTTPGKARSDRQARTGRRVQLDLQRPELVAIASPGPRC